MASLSELLAQAQTSKGGRPCPVDLLLQALKTDDREALKAQLVLDRSSTGYLPNHLVAKIVTDFGHEVDEKMIWRHRTGRCRCRGNL